MANLNDGQIVRFDNDGTISVGSDFVKNIVEGSMTFTEMFREPIIQMDRGRLQSQVLAGNERPGRLSFKIKVSSIVHTETGNDFYEVFFPADASGNRTTFTVVVKVFDAYNSSAAGKSYTFSGCFAPDGPVYRGNAGSNDEIDIDLTYVGGLVKADF